MFDREYVFYGKHAEMVKKLTAKASDEVGKSFFATNYDVYKLAPIIGWIYKRKAQAERGEGTTKIFAEKMQSGRDELIFNYRNLMLLMNKKNAMEIAFKLDEKPEERKYYDDLYNQYVLGGVEELYERIFGNGSTVDEYVMNYYEMIQDLNLRLYGPEENAPE